MIDRQVYSILDWAGDIGGLSGAATFVGSVIVGLLHYGKFDAMLIRELFRVKSVKTSNADNGKDTDEPLQYFSTV